MRNNLLLLALIPLAACATTKAGPVPEPQIVTVEVPVQGPPAACVPNNVRATPPEYPDTDEKLREAADAAVRMQLMYAGRLLRMGRLAELEPVVAACPREPTAR